MTATSAAPGRVYADTRDGIADIFLDNPSRYNAMSLAMWRELARLAADAAHDPAVRVLVLQGAGDKAFVSGADISEFGQVRDNPEQTRIYAEAVRAAQQALSACDKPVIAHIQGVCMGGGMGLALACDLRYCADDARFRMPAARLGLGYDLDGVQRMKDVLGAARTADLFFTARIFDGREAARIGLAHQSFAADALRGEVRRVAGEIALNAPLTLKAAKLSLRHLLGDPAVRDAGVVNAAVQACFDSSDYREGRAAFAEKRPPRFRGV